MLKILLLLISILGYTQFLGANTINFQVLNQFRNGEYKALLQIEIPQEIFIKNNANTYLKFKVDFRNSKFDVIQQEEWACLLGQIDVNNNKVERVLNLKPDLFTVNGCIQTGINTPTPKYYYFQGQYQHQNNYLIDDAALYYLEIKNKKKLQFGEILPRKTEKIKLKTTIHPPKQKLYLVRATLYYKDPNTIDEFAQHYIWENQIQTTTNRNSTPLEFDFDLRSLPDGDHLIEIYIFEDEKIIAEKSKTFTIQWDQLDDIEKNIFLSVQKMEPIVSTGWMQNWHNANDKKKTEMFHQFWKSKEDANDGSAFKALTYYYKIISRIESLFDGEKKPAWKTNRGRIYIQYGAPTTEKKITKNGIPFILWEYRRHHLVFIFEKKGDEWILRTDKIDF